MNNINYYPYYGYYGYWHKRYVNLIMNNPPVEEVYNPDTGEKLNIKNLLREFISNIENKQIDKVLEKYEKMSTFFKLSDNVDRQLKKLKDIYEYTGFSKEFEKQLEIVYNYLIKEEQKYIPISDKYFELYSNLKTQSKGISFLASCSRINSCEMRFLAYCFKLSNIRFLVVRSFFAMFIWSPKYNIGI